MVEGLSGESVSAEGDGCIGTTRSKGESSAPEMSDRSIALYLEWGQSDGTALLF